MSDWFAGSSIEGLIGIERVFAVLRALAVLVVGMLLARLAAAAMGRVLEGRLRRQEAILVRRFTFYALFGLVVATTLHQLGFHLGVLLGAAGVLTVALGFASQTSASNLISGLFLIAERPFVIGDVITVDAVTGEVLSIDLLSVKLRTFDNLYVRVPNESIIKSRVTNMTHFPIRRADLKIGVAYREDLARVEEILYEVADLNPLCLDEPKPLFIISAFGDSALEMQFSVWTKRENFLEMRNSLWRDIKVAFDAAGVEIPFPHVSVYAGSQTEPIPVRVTHS
ncbi:MAG: mechanosensitive ion channel protein MscS [Gemmatimonadota bacterium]|nr:MAG: mechanosensitive ion channel protein MscS [Gemmatimonadota bacterium]